MRGIVVYATIGHLGLYLQLILYSIAHQSVSTRERLRMAPYTVALRKIDHNIDFPLVLLANETFLIFRSN